MKVREIIMEEDPKFPALRDRNMKTVRDAEERVRKGSKAYPSIKRQAQEARRNMRHRGLGNPKGKDYGFDEE